MNHRRPTRSIIDSGGAAMHRNPREVDMTALRAVACYLPDTRVPVEDVARELGLTPMQGRLFRRYLGLAEIRVDDKGTLLDLLSAATGRLEGLRGQEHHVRYVLYARVMPVVAPYPVNPLRDLCQAFGLGHAVSFAVTHHACATGLLAVDLAGRLLAEDGDPDALALVLTGEKAFTRDARLVPGTSIFSEAAAACLVGADGPADRVLSYAASTRGEFNGRLDDMPDTAASFEKEYPGSLADAMSTAADQAGVTMGDLTLILPHNVNTLSWQRLCRRIGFPVSRVLLDNVPVTGHAFCADLFINYVTAVERGLLRPGDRYLIAAAGFGATFSAMVVEH
jgi:3-oxoacyl-[acyl-carrier-protein] synthase-3